MTSLGVTVHPTAVIAPNVELGNGTIVGEYVVLGRAPRGHAEGELRLVIGPGSVIRPFTTIYAGTTIGARLQTGQSASIREDNVIGDDVSIGTHAVLEFGNRLGSRIRVHTGCFLEQVTVEDDVFLGPHVVFTDDPHPQCPAYLDCVRGATVRRRARIGGNATILPGVQIGEDSLVGAGSVVRHAVAPRSVVAGNPAVELRDDIAKLACFAGIFPHAYSWLEPLPERDNEERREERLGRDERQPPAGARRPAKPGA